MTALIATSQRRMPQEGATIACLTGLMKAQRRLKDLRAKLRHMDKEGWEGEQGLRICAHADALNDKICRFAARAEKRGEEGATCLQYGGEIGTESHHDFLLDIGEYIDKEVREEQSEVRESRLAERKQELKVDWATGGGKMCYRAAKEASKPPTLVLSKPDGTLTADPSIMHEIIEEVWVKGVFNKKDTTRPREDWGEFMDTYRETKGERSEQLHQAWNDYESRAKQRKTKPTR